LLRIVWSASVTTLQDPNGSSPNNFDLRNSAELQAEQSEKATKELAGVQMIDLRIVSARKTKRQVSAGFNLSMLEKETTPTISSFHRLT
jgi:hypothetical protein